MNTREQAEEQGILLKAPKNDKLRRAPWHNYHLPGLYMITIVTLGRQRLLGQLSTLPAPHVQLSDLGETIMRDEICRIPEFYPNTRVWKTCIMPDHMHIVIEVMDEFEEKKHLGMLVTGFKVGCNRAYRKAFGLESGTMFERYYNDRIILPGMQYERWERYLDDNPRRLAIKRDHPEYFTTRYAVNICGEECQTFGNLFLLDIPDKMDVIVHRSDSDADYARKCAQWMACGERGGVLVSAGVAPMEKAVIGEASRRGYAVIMLCENGFGPLHKPVGEEFDLCARGQLLQVSPWDYHADRRRITRQQCLLLNGLATRIANHPA